MPRWDHVPARVGRVIVYVFAQARLLANDFWPGLMHAIIFWGFVVLTLGPDRQVMRTGDSVVFLAGELRLWENPGKTATRLIVVSLRR